MLRLHVKLLSPLCSASGIGRAGVVDRDVVFDREGLPYIPARRLKGLLRDAYGELMDCEELSALELPGEEMLFGRPGESTPGPLMLGNAGLEHAEILGNWLRWMVSKYPETFSREEVIALHTEIRHQTKIDREFGRAEHDTLRAIRLVRSGLEFYTPLQIEEGAPTASMKRALVLAAAGIRVMGVGRSRGFGHVRCRIQHHLPEGGWVGEDELLSEALAWLGAPSDDQGAGGSEPPSEHPGSPESHPESPEHRAAQSSVRYRIRLTTAAIFPTIGGDPFTVLTHDYVPGSNIRGGLATEYLKRTKQEPDPKFYRLFCGQLSFGPATPAIDGRDPSTPIPHSLRMIKSEERFVDLTSSDIREAAGLERHAGWSQVQKIARGIKAPRIAVAREIQYHHARPHDRRIQRALGPEDGEYGLTPSERGAFFAYEGMIPTQVFMGDIVGLAGDLFELRKCLSSLKKICIGRSRSAQYGGHAEWEWLDDSPATQPGPEGEETTERIVITLLSPLITLNRIGHPSPEFPLHELAQRIVGKDGEPSNLIMEKSFVRLEWHGGYLAHQHLPRRQYPAFAPGSVFVLRLSPAHSAAKLERAAQWSYGLQTEDGFGRISIRPIDSDHSHNTSEIRFDKETKMPLPSPVVVALEDDEGPCRALAMHLLENQLREAAVARGIRHAKYSQDNLHRVSAHLLARLSSMLEGCPLSQFSQRLVRLEPGQRPRPDMLRETARTQLAKTRIETDKEPIRTLLDVLRDGSAGQTELLKEKLEERDRFRCSETPLSWEVGESLERIFLEIVEEAYQSKRGWIETFQKVDTSRFTEKERKELASRKHPLLLELKDEERKYGLVQKPADSALAEEIVKIYLRRLLSGLSQAKRGTQGRLYKTRR